jgi:radical SAM protein with 4Fe4S-binding SPASM domain
VVGQEASNIRDGELVSQEECRTPGISLNEEWQPLVLGNLVRLAYPSNLVLDVHSYCNAACQVCPYPQLAPKLPKGRMTDGLFRKIIDEFSDIARHHPIRGHVVLSNLSEPFLDPHICEKISYVLAADLKVVLQTNASVLTPERVDQLLATGFRGAIYISCHGITPEVYRRVMGLKLEETLRHIDYLAQRYPRHLLQVRAISYKWPLGEAWKVKRYWQARQVPVKVFLPNSRTGLVPHLACWKLKYPGNKLKGCKKTLPLRDMVVAFTGDVLLCCEDMGREIVLGNLQDHSLLEVWNSAQAREVMAQIFLQKPSPEHFPCKTCEFGVSTRFRKIIRILDHEWHHLWKCYI